MNKKRHVDNRTGKATVEAIIYKDSENYVMAKYEDGKGISVSRVNNWLGVKKQYNITKNDLPLIAKGYRNKFSPKIFGKYIKDVNFVITRVFKSEDETE